MNIDSFRSTMGATDFYRPTKFSVQITRPGVAHLPPSTLTLLAYRAELPSIAHNALPARRYGVGPIFEYPTSYVITPVTLGFYVDGKTKIQEEFYAWTNEVLSSESNANGALPTHKVSYKDSYKGSVEISCFDNAGEVVRKVKLHNAFPTQVGNLSLDWEATNQVSRLNVRFTYDHFSFL